MQIVESGNKLSPGKETSLSCTHLLQTPLFSLCSCYDINIVVRMEIVRRKTYDGEMKKVSTDNIPQTLYRLPSIFTRAIALPANLDIHVDKIILYMQYKGKLVWEK